MIFGVTLTEMGIKRFTIKEETEEEEPVNNIFKTNNKRSTRGTDKNN